MPQCLTLCLCLTLSLSLSKGTPHCGHLRMREADYIAAAAAFVREAVEWRERRELRDGAEEGGVALRSRL